jgi:hypothetical protein
MNNKQIVTVAVVAGIAFVAYLYWKKSKTVAPVVQPPNSGGTTTTPTTPSTGTGAGGIIDDLTGAWDSLSGLFGNQNG